MFKLYVTWFRPAWSDTNTSRLYSFLLGEVSSLPLRSLIIPSVLDAHANDDACCSGRKTGVHILALGSRMVFRQCERKYECEEKKVWRIALDSMGTDSDWRRVAQLEMY